MKKLMLLLACLLMTAGIAMAQSRRVTGVVTDAADGSPLQGVRVYVNGTSIGTVTDAKGVFQLTSVPSKYKTLTVEFIGKKTLQASISSTMNLKMEDNQKVLDEAIVVAYGTAKKSAFTGSAKEIKEEEITNHVTANAVNALSGAVAGVQMTSSSGQPGSTGSIRIRGVGSMNASSSPLYIVDGAPTELGISTINPQDIASISVLKDAAASAIYGARGANGVIIVTTKKAKQGQPARVTFDAKWGSNSRLIPNYDVIDNAAQYYETQYKSMYNSIVYNGGTSAEGYAYANKNLLDKNNGGLGYQVYTVPTGENLIGTNFKLNPNATLGYSDGTYTYYPDNWYNETYHNSFRQEYNVNVSGSEGRLNYFGSVGYLDDGGFVNNSNYKRYTGRTSFEYQAKDWLKLTSNMAFTHTDNQTPSYGTTWASSGNLFYITNSMGAIYPLYVRDANGNIMTENGRTIYDANQTNFKRPSVVGNAVRDNEYNSYQSYSDIFTGQWGAHLDPFKNTVLAGLTFDANFNVQSYNERSRELYSIFAIASSVDGAADVAHSRTLAVNQQYLVNYSKTFNRVHNLTLLAGYEQYKVKDQGLEGYNDHLYDPYIGELNNALGTEKKLAQSSTDNLSRAGWLGRAQYNYDEKYFASASIRRDASSKFAPGHRWGTFGSVGLAWQLNKEDFMKPYEWVDLLKLKASYGVQGNDGGMGYHAYADRYSTSYNNTTGEYSITMIAKGNNNLTWEKNKEWNFGLEWGLFDNRLNGSFEVYTRNTSDLLYSKTLPLSSGLQVSSYPVNVGSMRNTGIELELNGIVLKTKDIEWDLNFNLTHNHNEITKLDPSVAKNGIKSSYYILREGGSFYEAYMVKYAGVDKTNGKAQYYVKNDVYKKNADGTNMVDADGDPIVDYSYDTKTYDITKASKYDIGTTMPDVYGGFGTTFKAYGFDLSAQFAFQLGGKIYDGAYQALMHNGISAGMAMHKDLLNAWSPENTNSDIPRLSTAASDDPGSGSQTPMDRFLTSSNYLSLNNLTLGYTFPKQWLSAIKIENIRVYVAGENLFVTTARKGLDPRYNYGLGSMTYGSGMSTSSYATMRSITAGISFTF